MKSRSLKIYMLATLFSVSGAGVLNAQDSVDNAPFMQQKDTLVIYLDGIKNTRVEKKAERPVVVKPKWNQRYALGVHVGIDIGGAVPWPPAFMRSNEMKMSAIPKLNPSLGLSYTGYLSNRISITGAVTYKQVGIDAEAWVSGQKFRIPNSDGEDLITQFRGTANVVMDFSMIEVPIYIAYNFSGGRSRLYLGGYYSYIFNSNFNTTPMKGLVSNPNDPAEPPIIISPEMPVPPEVMPAFSDYLDNWDAGLLLGYEWQIIPRVNMTARISMGFKDIFRKGSNYLEYKMLHMRGTVAISYSFLKYK